MRRGGGAAQEHIVARLTSILSVFPLAPGDVAGSISIATGKLQLIIDQAGQLYGTQDTYWLLALDATSNLWFKAAELTITRDDAGARKALLVDVPVAGKYHLLAASPVVPSTAQAWINEQGGALGGVQGAYFAAPPAAASTGVNAGILPSAAANAAFTGTFNPLLYPRNARVAFPGDWDGGNVTVTGTRFGATVSEVVVANPGASVDSVQVFDQITGATKGAAVGTGASRATIGWGTQLGLPAKFTSALAEFVDNAAETPSSISVAQASFVPTTAPNGTHNYLVLAK